MKYVGLTDDPQTRWMAHGRPGDWQQISFGSEWQARAWEKSMISQGYKGGPGGAGWRYGYTYTISYSTVEG